LGFGEGQWQVRTFSLRKVKITLCKKFLKMSNNRRFFKKKFLYFSDVWQGAIADPSIVFERKESTPPPPPPFA
jgi:hypothetical protein